MDEPTRIGRPALAAAGLELLRSPVAAALVLLAGAGLRGCGPLPIPPIPPIPVPEPAVPKEPGGIFPDDAPAPPAPHVFGSSQPRWEWRDLGPKWPDGAEGYGREVDGEFLYKWVRRRGSTSAFELGGQSQ